MTVITLMLFFCVNDYCNYVNVFVVVVNDVIGAVDDGSANFDNLCLSHLSSLKIVYHYHI